MYLSIIMLMVTNNIVLLYFTDNNINIENHIDTQLVQALDKFLNQFPRLLD